MALTTVPVELASLDGAVTVNESSADADFRVESNGSANMLFVDGGNDEVVIQKASSGATATAGSVLIVEDDDNTELSILGGSSSLLALNFGHSGDADDGIITYNTTSGSEAMGFSVAGGTTALTLNSTSATFGGQVIAPNGATSGYYLKQTGGTATPRVTNDGNEWTILRPGASGADVAINNYANSANLVTFTDEGNVGINETTPTSYYSKTLQINGSGNTSAIKLTNTSTGNENGRGMDIAADVTNLRIVNREVGSIEFHTGPVGSPALGLSLDTNGHVRMPKQSSVSAYLSSDMTDISVNTWHTITFNAERFDQNGDFNSTSSNVTLNGVSVQPYHFCAPTTGKYLLNLNFYLKNMDNAANFYQVLISTSNKSYYTIYDPDVSTDSAYWDMQWSAVVDMDEGDIAYIQIHQNGGSAQMDIDGQSTLTISLLH